jgi:GT2 family glycosyltransferase
MKPASAAPALRLSILPEGVIEGFGTGNQPAEIPGQVGIVLDGVVYGTARLSPDREGACLRFTLPRHLLFAEMDVIDPASGESLVGLPLDLSGAYAISMQESALHGQVLEGAFSAADFLPPELGIEWVDGSWIAAQALASRTGSEPVWRFRMQLLALPRPGQKAQLRARIGGCVQASPVITLSPEDFGFAGCLDAASADFAEGWAIDLKHPDKRVELEVFVDGVFAGSTVADQPRPDVQRLVPGADTCGFIHPLPPHADPAARRRIAVRLAGQTLGLAGSPMQLKPVPGLTGYFDSLHGMYAHGWALNHAEPDVPVQVEVVEAGGTLVATGTANQFRGDLLDAGMKEGHCAFKIDLSAQFEALMDKELFVKVAGTNLVLAGSPQRVTINKNILRFMHRRRALPPAAAQRLRRALNHRAGTRGISFIMPVHNPPRAWLVEAMESVRTQFCDAWELICVDDGSTAPHVADVLNGYAARDRRIRVLRSPQNVGIARAVNYGLRIVRYDYVAFVDHDDRLEPDAAWQLISAATRTDADLLYSDEAQTADNTEAITELRLRPAFSHDYYLSHPYFVHLVCARTDLARRIGGWDESLPISADVDFVLRMIEASRNVVHVPAVLYRWRTHSASTGHAKQESVMQATMGALQRHLDRLNTGATVRKGVWFNQFRVDWPASDGKILIVIPTRNKTDLLRVAIESIERYSKGIDYRLVVIDHQSDEPESRAYLKEVARRHVVMPYEGAFNFSRMNNVAVARHGRDAAFLLFLNNDIEATQDGFLDRLRRLANRRDVGAVGALLMYADKTVQHAGVILGFNDSAEHALKFQPVWLNDKGRRNLGYNCALSSTRDYSAVTAACLMVRSGVFKQVGGFDEQFGIGFNDTDLCLRIAAAGYRNLYDGSTLLYHYESATRSETQQVFHPEDTKLMVERWGDFLRAGDPFYNPNLSLRTQDHVPREDPACRVAYPPRVTKLDLARLRGQPKPSGRKAEAVRRRIRGGEDVAAPAGD